MRFFAQVISLLASLGLLGLSILADLLQITGEQPEGLLSALLNPWWSFGCALTGMFVGTFAGGSMVADYILNNAGGRTKREFNANYEIWDRLKALTVWQVQWLWNGLEPQNSDEKTEGTKAYPTFRWLKERLDAGDIPKAQKKDESWVWATMTRQEWIDFAYKMKMHPRFLFPHRRSLLERFDESAMKFRAKTTTHYRDKWFYDRWWMNTQGTTDLNSWRAKEANLREACFAGIVSAIGRKKRGEYSYEYQHIPAWKWEFQDEYGNTLVEKEYADILFKFPDARAEDVGLAHGEVANAFSGERE